MRVWVGNLGKYNEGELVGEWITLPMPKNHLDDILRNKVSLQLTQQEVDEALRTTGECYEEYFIADSECPELPNYQISEYADINQLNMLAAFINKCDYLEAVDAYIDAKNINDIYEICNVLAQADDLNYNTTSYEAYLNDNELIGYRYVDEVYGDAGELYEQSPETYKEYIDYEALGRDYSINSKYDVENGMVNYNGELMTEYEFGMAIVDEYGLENILGDTYKPEFYFDAEKFGRDIGGDYVVVSNNYGHQSIFDISEDIDSKYYNKDELYELVEDDIKSQPIIDKSILQNDETFRYRLLDRMKTDCNYFLGNGNRLDKFLWAGNVESQIAYMKALYNSFPDDKKPEWISLDDINNYEDAMTNDEVSIAGNKDEPDICD